MKFAIIISGPTAVGKTSVAIDVAKHFQTEILSADSRQCYRELKIGVARPSDEQLAAVPHHFIASRSIQEKITAADFEKYALEVADKVFNKNDVLVVTGGTGLYIQAFCEGLDQIPEVPDTIHEEVVAAYNRHGLEWLQDEIRKNDPGYYSRGEIMNPRRLMRALEVYLATGHSILSFQKGVKAQRNFRIIKTALHLPRPELNERINKRVDLMMETGLLEEVRSLLPYQHLNALQTVGYRELFDHLNGKISLNDAVELVKKNSRQYAKRQMTWFRKDADYTWFPPSADELKGWLSSAIS